jgi:hypothetical protein
VNDPATKDEYVSKPIAQIQSLRADLLFIDNRPCLITVSTPLNLILVSDLNGKENEDVLSDFIIRHVNNYKSGNFTVDLVYCDREGRILASKKIIERRRSCFKLILSWSSVLVIERNIRTVKERISSILCTSPFRVPYVFMPYLVDFAILRIIIPCRSPLWKIQVLENY